MALAGKKKGNVEDNRTKSDAMIKLSLVPTVETTLVFHVSKQIVLLS